MTRPIVTDIIARDKSTETILRVALEYSAMANKIIADNEKMERAQLRAAAANKALGDAMHKADDQAATYHTRYQRILDVALLLGPTMASAAVAIGAGAAGGVLGLGALGIAGQLAFSGIAAEMKNNTQLGMAYVGVFAPIRNEYHKLQELAAGQVFPGIASAMNNVRKLFPLFASDVKILSGNLGTIIANLGTALVPAIRQLNPLFLSMGGYLVTISARFADWAQGGGFTKFVSYAKQELPKVEKLFGSVWQALVHLTEALKPLGGNALLGGITNLSLAISHIPVPVLTAMIVALSVGRLLAIANALGAISAALLTTPVGLVIAALAAVGGGLYLLWTHWDQVWTWMSHHKAFAIIIAAVLAIQAPFVLAVAAVRAFGNNWATVWDRVKSIALTVWGALQTAWNAVIGAFKTAVSAVVAVASGVSNAWKTTVSALQTAWNAIASAATTAWNAVVKTVKTAIDTVKTTVSNVGSFFAHIWDSAWNATVKVFSAIGDWLHQHWPQILIWLLLAPIAIGIELERHWKAIQNAIVSALEGALNYIKGLPGKLTNIFQTAGAWLVNAGWRIIQGLVGGIVLGATTLWDWYNKLRARISAFLTNAGQWLIGTGQNLITGMVNGIVAAAQAVWNWLRLLPGRILSFLVAAGNWLVQTGRNLITGFVNGIVAAAAAVWNWLTLLPGRILGFFRAVINWLFGSGANLLTGFLHGIWQGAIAVYNWFTGLPAVIRGFLSGAASILYNSGKAIIQGFWDGLLFVWNKVTSFIGGIVGWIIKHKGPISLDKTILYPAGVALMEGLVTGLMHGFTNVVKFVGGIGGWVAGQLAKQAASIGGGFIPGGPHGSVSANVIAEHAYAASLFPRFGWSVSDQMGALISLWNEESGWNPGATNASSGAYGIPQALPASKLAEAGADWRTNPATQILWGLNYIKQRYGTPSAAWAFETSHTPNWYKQGAWNIARDELAYLHRGEMVVPEPTASQVRQGGGSAREIGREVAAALSGMAFQFDSDGLLRIVTRGQDYAATRGVRR